MERFVPGPVRSARAEVERSLRERLDFEALITDVTARVVAATPETIDAALLEALEELRVAVGADRAVLLEYSEDLSSSFITHVAYRAGVSRVPERVDMRALFPWSNNRIAAGETVTLFRSHNPNYADGGQMRDFVYVDDVVDVIEFLLQSPQVSGIFNAGSGQARSFADLARATFDAAGKTPSIDYVDTPLSIRDRYQYFTEARMDRIRGRLAAVPGVRDCEVNLVWDPPWDMAKMSDEAKLELGML